MAGRVDEVEEVAVGGGGLEGGVDVIVLHTCRLRNHRYATLSFDLEKRRVDQRQIFEDFLG